MGFSASRKEESWLFYSAEEEFLVIPGPEAQLREQSLSDSCNSRTFSSFLVLSHFLTPSDTPRKSLLRIVRFTSLLALFVTFAGRNP